MLHTTTDSDDDAAHVRHLAMLKELATSKYQLPPDVAEELAKDVLLASLRHSQSTEWLTGALVCAVRSYVEDKR